MRKLKGRFTEIDLWEKTACEKLRSAPVIVFEDFAERAEVIPEDVETALKKEPEVT